MQPTALLIPKLAAATADSAGVSWLRNVVPGPNADREMICLETATVLRR